MSKIAIIRSAVQSSSTTQLQVSTLAGTYRKRRCWILSCSSELNEYTDSELADAIAPNDCVICVKQAIFRAPRCDFHLLNRIKLSRYIYSDQAPVSIGYQQTGRAAPPCDIVCQLEATSYRLGSSVTARGNFDDWLFEKQTNRPFGPGIVNELGFYLALHLGCREIVTLGYDSGWETRFDGGTMTDEMRYIVDTQPKWRAWLESKGVPWRRGAEVIRGMDRICSGDVP